MDLVNKIRALRESKGLTQEDLADKFGVTRSNYAYLEGRGSKLTIEQLEKIAVALGVSVVELLTGEGQKVQDSEEVEKLRKRITELETFLNLSEIVSDKRLNDLRQILSVFFHDVFNLAIENSIKQGVITKEDYEGWIEVKIYELGNDSIKIIGLGKRAKERGFVEFPIDLHLFMSEKQIKKTMSLLFSMDFIGDLIYHMFRLIKQLKVIENKELEKIISYGMEHAFRGNYFVPNYIKNFPSTE